MSDPECVELLQWALPRLGLRWLGFRRVRSLVRKRLGRRLRLLGLATAGAYREYLAANPQEWAVLDELCRIPISRCWRDRGVFEALAFEVLPELARTARAAGESRLDCWSAGCASGEEVFSLAIAWRFAVARDFPELRLHILGTDIDEHLLSRAARGCYPKGTLRELPSEWRREAFVALGEEWCIRPELREGIELAAQDIRAVMPDGPFRLILCRNLVFTYFDEALQRVMLDLLYRRLLPAGALVIGAREVLPAGAGLVPWRRQFSAHGMQLRADTVAPADTVQLATTTTRSWRPLS